jgi:NADH-quinone oxidoreductase subunit M
LHFRDVISNLPFINYGEVYFKADFVSVLLTLSANVMAIFFVTTNPFAMNPLYREWHMAIHLANILLVGVFSCKNVKAFFIITDFSLLPIFTLIFLYGGNGKNRTILNYFLSYTLLGSMLTLALVFGFNEQIGGISLHDLGALPLGPRLFLLVTFFLSFSTKVIVFPPYISR